MNYGKLIKLTPSWGVLQLTKHKYFEYQIEFSKFADQPFEFSCRWTSKRDHAGLDFIFSIYRLFWFNVRVYDHRHWDYENDCWQTYLK